MKLAVTVILILTVLGCQGQTVQPVAKTLTNLIQGGQTMANLALMSGTQIIAPFVNGFVEMSRRVREVGKRCMLHLDQMLSHVDENPHLRALAEAMHQNLYDLETAVDGLVVNSRWGGEVVKIASECVAPQFEAIANIKDKALKGLATVVEKQRSALADMTAAGYSIGDQVQELEGLEKRLAELLASGKGLEAMAFIVANRPKTEKGGRLLQKVYLDALDNFRETTGANIKELSATLGQVYEDGDQVTAKLDNCMGIKMARLVKDESKKKAVDLMFHVIPEHLAHARKERVWPASQMKDKFQILKDQLAHMQQETPIKLAAKSPQFPQQRKSEDEVKPPLPLQQQPEVVNSNSAPQAAIDKLEKESKPAQEPAKAQSPAPSLEQVPETKPVA